MDSLQQNRLQLGLAELYCNETGINSLSDNLGQKQQVAAATSSKLEKCEQTLKNYKKEHGRLTREQQLIEKEIRCVGETFLFYSIFLSSSISLRPHRSKCYFQIDYNYYYYYFSCSALFIIIKLNVAEEL